MKLRTQLSIVSLATLILPWVVFQYFLTFDQLIRNEQNATLSATANAIVARLRAEPKLFALSINTTEKEQLYAHILPSPPILDGFQDDWQTYNITPQKFVSDTTFNANVRAGILNQTLTIFLDVTDPDVYYHTPGSKALATGDHLVIATSASELEHKYFIIHAESPGSITALYRDDLGNEKTDYRIKGFWQDTSTGYQVELQLPASLFTNNFSFSVVNTSPFTAARAVGTMDDIALIAGGRDPGILPAITGEIISINTTLQKAISAFSQENLQLSVIDKNRWLVAKSGTLQKQIYNADNFWLWQGLLSFIHNKRQLEAYSTQNTGKNLQPSVERALVGESLHTWYSDKNTDIGTFATPIYLESQESDAIETRNAGILLVEARRNPLQLIEGKTFLYLLGITIVGGLLLSLLLIGYASWLSFRIKRLSVAATQAQQNQKQLDSLLQHWPRSVVNDELSDLSDHYYQLLQRVRGYTDYLKTLSSKLSHELRTPLAVIRTSLDNLSNAELTPEAKKYSARAQEGGERLSTILTAMTEATRVEASIQNAERESVDLGVLTTEMINAYKDIYAEHTFVLDVVENKAQAYKTCAAPELLVQMLDKLIDNATDFSPKHNPINIQLQRIEATAPYFQLIIKNQGPPLPRHLEGKLFDSLTSARPQASAEDNKVHLGLGLQVVALITQFHQGRATIASNLEPPGVSVTITLPVQEPEIRVNRV